jgi:flagellar basal body rod protein FlgG
MAAALQWQERIFRNVANVNTTGYKAEKVSFRQIEELLLSLGTSTDQAGEGTLPLAAGLPEGPIDLSQGPLWETDRELDVAIDGPAFFVVQGEQGELLTRDGAFGLDAQRRLVTKSGLLVLGDGGPIQLPPGQIAISAEGAIYVNGQRVSSIRLAIPEGNLQRAGENMFSATTRQAQAGEARVLQGYLERANVNLQDEMAKAMAALRTYEAAQRLLLAQNQTLDALGRAVQA